MGWDFRVDPCSKQEIIEECLNSVALQLIDKSVQGNELWVVWERKTDKHRFICVYLLKSEKRCWGYKEIDEAAGPHYYRCPLSFFALVPVANQGWREKVVDYHEKRLNNRTFVRRIAVGTIVALDNPSNEFRVTHMKPLQGLNLKERRLYRLVKSRVVSVRETQE
jgi:hypothetical protein